MMEKSTYFGEKVAKKGEPNKDSTYAGTMKKLQASLYMSVRFAVSRRMKCWHSIGH